MVLDDRALVVLSNPQTKHCSCSGRSSENLVRANGEVYGFLCTVSY